MQLFLKILSGMTNSVDLDQTCCIGTVKSLVWIDFVKVIMYGYFEQLQHYVINKLSCDSIAHLNDNGTTIIMYIKL